MSELVVLGSAGWIPQEARMTTALALRFDDTLFLFDAGTGLARLYGDPHQRLVPAAGAPVHMFLTHLHLDHTMGLTFLPALWTNPTVVHFPGSAEGTSDAGAGVFGRVFGGPFFPLAFADLLPDISLEPAWPGETLVEGHTVRARRQQHPGGSLGYRIDDALAFITDTAYDPAAADLARGVRILVHEAWGCEPEHGPATDGAGLNNHSTAEDAARLAKEAGVGELLLSHLPPFEEQCYADMITRSRAIFPRTELCSDGLVRRLD